MNKITNKLVRRCISNNYSWVMLQTTELSPFIQAFDFVRVLSKNVFGMTTADVSLQVTVFLKASCSENVEVFAGKCR